MNETNKIGNRSEYKHILERRLEVSRKVLIFGVAVLFFAVLTVVSILFLSRSPVPQLPLSLTETEQGEDLARKSVEIGNDKVIRGVFKKADQGNIYLEVGKDLKQFELADEVGLRCSQQTDLATSERYYLNDITFIEPVELLQLNEKISQDSTVVVFLNVFEGVDKVYAVVKNEGCLPK